MNYMNFNIEKDKKNNFDRDSLDRKSAFPKKVRRAKKKGEKQEQMKRVMDLLYSRNDY
jgi:hypothetical protein